MSDKRLNFGVVKTERGLDGILEMDITERVNYGAITNSMKSSLKKAIRNGVAPVNNASFGKLASLYTVLCKHFDMPRAFLSASNRTMQVYGGSDSKEMDTLFEHLNALHLLTTNGHTMDYKEHWINGEWTKCIHGYSSNIPIKTLVEQIAEHRPIDHDKMLMALAVIDKGQSITFKHETIHS